MTDVSKISKIIASQCKSCSNRLMSDGKLTACSCFSPKWSKDKEKCYSFENDPHLKDASKDKVLSSSPVKKEMVNHPAHYQDPSGVECITIIRHRDFNIGSAIKYLWRAGLKEEEGMSLKEKQIEDLEKAIWYIKDEIELIKKQKLGYKNEK
jgi:hypothetical protein